MNLGDPELELIDPTPNVHSLFLHFDKIFFWAKLASRAVVRWSKRMYSCAGICSYEGRGGLCDIALSEPLLKLRPRKDLIETLLHEMIHAFLFVTCRDQDRDGHGPNFKAHMHRINNSAGINISIYHSFHDEVKLYQTHVWRCNGPCQSMKPFFGIVRQPINRTPGPSFHWWKEHLRRCGGTFIKISGPEKKQTVPKGKKAPPKPNADITKYIIDNKSNNIATVHKPVLKDSNSIPAKTNAILKSNSSSTMIVTQKDLNGSPKLVQSTISFTGKGHILDNNKKRSNSVDVMETVRNKWANKQLNASGNISTKNKQLVKSNSVVVSNPNKHKSNTILPNTPPTKMTKIDDYLHNASRILKDIYDEDIDVKVNNNDNKKLSIVAVKKELVDCPICKAKVNVDEINRHIDECLNKDVIEKLTQDSSVGNVSAAADIKTENNSPNNLRSKIGEIAPIPNFKGKIEMKNYQIPVNTRHTINTIEIKSEDTIMNKVKSNSTLSFDDNDVNTVRSIVHQINAEKQREFESGASFIEKKPNINFLPINIDDLAGPVKIEPGTSNTPNGESKECACCGDKIEKPLEEHLDECLAFFNNSPAISEGETSTSFTNETIVIDDDDDFDETLTFNPTGTKYPCPCCMKMIEEADMNGHLDSCMNSGNN